MKRAFISAMRARSVVLLGVLMLAGTGVLSAQDATHEAQARTGDAAAAVELTADQIVARAIERSERQIERLVDAEFGARMFSTSCSANTAARFA